MAARYRRRLGWRSLRKAVGKYDNGRYILSPQAAKRLSEDLADAMYEYGITTERRAAMFIAQITHESDNFRAREEYASGAAYEGRRDLGNTQEGDGRRFKGRSYIQITGRANYKQLPKWDGIDFVKNPQKLALPKYAAKSAAWWWKTHGCNELADNASFDAVTRRINGGYNGKAHRDAVYSRARRVAKYLTPKRRPPV